MKKSRYRELCTNENANLTDEEVRAGWHWCGEFDGLLVQGDPTILHCGQACVDGEMNPKEFDPE